MRFLFVCGGTGGHINPALAIAARLKERLPGSEFLFVGSGREMEKKLVPAEGFELVNITSNSFTRGISLGSIKDNIHLMRTMSVSIGESEQLIKRFKPDAAIGTGGYVCYPVLKTAAKMGIPTLLHESNAVPGLTTKMLSDRVKMVMVAFPGAVKYYRHPEKVRVTGTPVRGDFLTMTKQQAKHELGTIGKPLVVSLWGSLGASAMNEYMADFIKLNADSGSFYHIHATGGGESGLEEMQQRLKLRGIEQLPDFIDVRPYIYNMGTVMNAADLILCRAGASTIAELTLLGKPSILVPSPNVTNNHQEKNAREIEKAGGAKMIIESECNGKMLYDTALALVTDRDKLSDMSEYAKKLGKPDSATEITDIILSLIN